MRSPELQQVVDILLAQRAEQAEKGPLTVAERRVRLDSLADLFPLPADVTAEPVEAGGRPALRLTPPGTVAGQALLYLHGGAYSRGSPRSHQELAARIARAARSAVVVLDYRLAPEDPFPAAVDDAVAAWRSLSGERLMLAGDSAGGGLALATAVALRDAGDPMPARVAVISPWTDLTCSSPSFAERVERDPECDPTLADAARVYLGGTDPRTPLASPLFADLAGLPPTLIQVGTEEILFDDSARIADALRDAGVEAEFQIGEDLTHVYHAFPVVPEAADAVARLGAFLRAG